LGSGRYSRAIYHNTIALVGCTNRVFFIKSLLSVLMVILIYLFNTLHLKHQTDAPFIQNHLNDVLVGIFLLALINILSLLFNQPKLIVQRLPIGLGVTLLAGLFWEYVTPLYLTRSVSDPLDLIAYLLGGFVYWYMTKARL
jgi:hypothetical protein